MPAGVPPGSPVSPYTAKTGRIPEISAAMCQMTSTGSAGSQAAEPTRRGRRGRGRPMCGTCWGGEARGIGSPALTPPCPSCGSAGLRRHPRGTLGRTGLLSSWRTQAGKAPARTSPREQWNRLRHMARGRPQPGARARRGAQHGARGLRQQAGAGLVAGGTGRGRADTADLAWSAWRHPLGPPWGYCAPPIFIWVPAAATGAHSWPRGGGCRPGSQILKS